TDHVLEPPQVGETQEPAGFLGRAVDIDGDLHGAAPLTGPASCGRPSDLIHSHLPRGQSTCNPRGLMPQLSCHIPVGDITIHEWDGAIVSLDWGWGSLQEPSPLLKEAKCQLEAYFDGDLKTFDLPLAPGGTSFFTRLWRRLMDIPYG